MKILGNTRSAQKNRPSRKNIDSRKKQRIRVENLGRKKKKMEKIIESVNSGEIVGRSKEFRRLGMMRLGESLC